MTDDLIDLKEALAAASPDLNPETKAAHLALAQKNFAILQETMIEARHTSARPKTGLWTGARNMLSAVSSRTGLTLTLTTAIVAVGVVVLSPIGDDLLRPPTLGNQSVETNTNVGNQPDRMLEELLAEVAPDTKIAPEPQVLGAPAAPDRRLLAETAEEPESYSALAAPIRSGDQSLRSGSPAFSMDRLVSQVQQDEEAYANAASQSVQITSDDPVSTFSIDVDTASYAVIRNSLQQGYLPSQEAVRIEEMINYFNYAYPAPDGDIPFRPSVTVMPTPWNADTKLLHIGIQGTTPDVEDRPPLNLVFLIDTSGSMQAPNKLPLLKQSLRLMLSQLRPEDEVAIVTYAGQAGQVLEPTSANERTRIIEALDQLEAGGGTAGEAGLEQAYGVAEGMTGDGEVTRIILATDGDFNIGIDDPDQLKEFIARKRDAGTYLSVLGFGRGNLDDATMQALAQNGNGQAAYIDTLSEAQKVLVDQLTGSLFPIANDVKIQMEFNPAQVAEYRLIGYATRALRREDFNNDDVDAGEIGAGHTVTALYEITPVGSPARLSDPLRYGEAETVNTGDELAFMRIRYKSPGSQTSQMIETPITADLNQLSESGFAAAIAGFGQLLRQSGYMGDWTFENAIALANNNRGDDAFGYRTEAVQLMRLARSLSEN